MNRIDSYTKCKGGKIKKARDLYKKLHVPLEQMLSDYNDVLTFPEELENALNPWVHLQHKIKGHDVVSDITAMETAFTLAAMTLHAENPIDVIKAIHYESKTRNEIMLETTCLELFENRYSSCKKLLFINPSPFGIEWAEAHPNYDVRYVLQSQVWTELLNKQYEGNRFGSLCDPVDADFDAVIFSTLLAKEPNEIMTVVTQQKDVPIFGIMHTKLLDNKTSSFWKMMRQTDLQIDTIINVPKSMSFSTPVKKIMISLKKATSKEIKYFNLNYDPNSTKASISDKCISLKQDDLIKRGTLKQLIDHINEESEVADPPKTREAALTYEFSKEIIISYCCYEDSTRQYVKVYYAETVNTVMPLIRGKVLTKRYEKSVYNNAECIRTVIEDLVFTKLNDAIVDDIKNAYLTKGVQTSAKTLWFCLRDVLMQNRSYDDETAKDFFSAGSDASKLYLGLESSVIIQATIDNMYSAGQENRSLWAYKMLNKIAEEAIKRGYISDNKILPLLPSAINRANKRQAEVRQALVKKSFSAMEENRIIKFLLSECDKSSLYLAALIRCMTGISMGEVCALNWQDYNINAELGFGQLLITKYFDNKGNLKHYAYEENWYKYRTLPISKFLNDILKTRKDSLIGLGIRAETLNDYPIVIIKEGGNYLRKGFKPRYCKTSIVAQKCREAISKAEIPQQMMILPDEKHEIEVDMNSYNGDIYKANFNAKTRELAGFEIDELCYYLGIKGPDTYSQHYCDYSNDYVQYLMAGKLDRWQGIYGKRKAECWISPEYTMYQAKKGINEGLAKVDIVIQKKEELSDMIAIEMEAEYGYKIFVQSFGR